MTREQNQKDWINRVNKINRVTGLTPTPSYTALIELVHRIEILCKNARVSETAFSFAILKDIETVLGRPLTKPTISDDDLPF